MPIFGRSGGDAKRVDPAHALEQAVEHWHAMSGSPDPVLSDGGGHLADAIRLAQIAAAAGQDGATRMLGSAYLVAASLPCSRTTPSDPIIRFAGLAAVALGRAGPIDPDVNEWFRRARNRFRGSVFVPRDVEYAFSGMYEVLEKTALEPGKYDTVRKLLADAIRDARLWAAHKIVDADPAFEGKEARARAAQAEKILPQLTALAWDEQDLASMRASSR